MKMQDKKAKEAEKRKQHKEQLKATRRQEPILERVLPTLLEKPTFLIVCEGKNTEPSYFKQFRLSTATIKIVGLGFNTTSLVKRAIQLYKEKQYDQVWCVFDYDGFKNFNNAIITAEANQFGVAYSNQAFEYWLILHLDDHQGGGMNRTDYNKKINELLKPYNLNYDGEKSKVITEEIFEVLYGIDEKTKKERIQLAIERAKRNFKHHGDKDSPALCESSTTVFKLVEELLKYK